MDRFFTAQQSAHAWCRARRSASAASGCSSSPDATAAAWLALAASASFKESSAPSSWMVSLRSGVVQLLVVYRKKEMSKKKRTKSGWGKESERVDGARALDSNCVQKDDHVYVCVQVPGIYVK